MLRPPASRRALRDAPIGSSSAETAGPVASDGTFLTAREELAAFAPVPVTLVGGLRPFAFTPTFAGEAATDSAAAFGGAPISTRALPLRAGCFAALKTGYEFFLTSASVDLASIPPNLIRQARDWAMGSSLRSPSSCEVTGTSAAPAVLVGLRPPARFGRAALVTFEARFLIGLGEAAWDAYLDGTLKLLDESSFPSTKVIKAFPALSTCLGALKTLTPLFLATASVI